MTGHLLHNLILFGRLLRGLGLDINPGRVMDAAQALAFVEIGRKPDFYFTLRTLLVHRYEDLAIFDQAYEAFWRAPLEGWEIKLPPMETLRRRSKPQVRPPSLGPREAAGGEAPPQPDPGDPPVVELTLTYSPNEMLRQKDFAEMTGEELEAVKQLMAALIWQLGQRRTRRRRAGRGQLIDIRRTLRKNIRYGEVLDWAHREPKYKPRPLVIIADISGSMERYTRLILQFIYSLAEGLAQQVEAFVFSTRLTRISRQLRGRDLDRALREVARAVPDWSGGTRIGDALKTFNFEWGRRVLGGGAVVLLISDGWDRGEMDVLSEEMARLQRNCHRLIWLNPLLGSPDYEPLTRGMQAALPHIDDFLPVHNLASLEALAEHLTRLGDRRAARRQAKMPHPHSPP